MKDNIKNKGLIAGVGAAVLGLIGFSIYKFRKHGDDYVEVEFNEESESEDESEED